MCATWRRIVTENSTAQYTTRMGQKTGTSKAGKSVSARAAARERSEAHQNCAAGVEGGRESERRAAESAGAEEVMKIIYKIICN